MLKESFKNSAHDLNNILTSIVNGIELLKQSTADNKELQPVISKLESSTKRAMKIINNHLTPSESEKKQIEKIYLPELVQEIIGSLPEHERKFIEIHSQENIPFILIDETDLYRVIFNLIKNSLEAINEDGKIFISISVVEEQEKSYVQFNIIDNGIGINSDYIPKIFDSEFSTKSKGRQSGRGLAIVKEKTEEYGGSIKVQSQKGKTEFTLKIPGYNQSKKNRKNILIAEDDIYVSEVLSDLLRSHGYDVSIASTGNETIEVIKKSFFDALIIDKIMPEMDGIDCIKNVRTYNTEVPIILASGSEIDLKSEDLQNLNIGSVIKKPYSFPEILTALQKFNL